MGQIILLGVLTAILPVAIDGMAPALPAIGQGLATDPSLLPAVMSAFVISFAIGQLIGGMCADALGRRPVVLAGLAIFTLAGVLGAMANSFPLLLAARALQGFGAAAVVLLARTIVRDQLGREDAARALALIGIIMSLAPLIAPLVSGGLVALGGWRAPLFAMAVMGVLVTILSVLRLKETLPSHQRLPFDVVALLGSMGGLVRSRPFMSYVFANSFAYSGILLFSAAAPQMIIGHLGVSTASFSVMFAVALGGFLIGNVISLRLVRRLGVDGALRVGVLFVAAGPALMLFATTLWPLAWLSLIVPHMIYTMGWGMVQPQAQAGALSTHPESIGQASALLGFFQLAMAGLIAALFTRLTTGLPPSLAMTLLFCGGMAALCAWFLVRKVPR